MGLFTDGVSDEQTAAWRDEADQLLDRIEDDDVIPEWCWPRMTSVLGKMHELPDYLGWLPVRFLQDVINRGAEVFNVDRTMDQRRLFGDDDRPTLVCSCGSSTGPARPARAGGGRLYLYATCGECHSDVVDWQREGRDSPV